jgi:hypothetical protein
MMTLADQLLLCLAHPLLRRNFQFEGRHEGESCYVFGNGASLKGMDLSQFSDRISIGCNSLFLHKDFNKLDCQYYFLPAAFLFHRYRKYYGRWRRNYMGDLYREKILENPGVSFFTSLSNWVGLRTSNLYYTHHFGRRTWDFGQARLDGHFSFMQGAMYAMIGLAFWMGFKSITLVGCDYAFSPRYGSHFFEKGLGEKIENVEENYGGEFFSECAKVMNLSIMVPNGVQSKLMHWIEYSDHASKPFSYRENTEIVSWQDLELLAKQGAYNIF